MDIKQGKFESKEVVKGVGSNNKPYVRYVFTVGGKTYSTFNADEGAKEFGVGDDVVVKGMQNGKFWNMDTIDLDTEPVAPVQEQLPPIAQSNNDVVRLLTQIRELLTKTVELVGDIHAKTK